VIAGPFGAEGRLDVLGKEGNVAATLPTRTVSLSAEAFRCLENGERKPFKKHTPAVAYIRPDTHGNTSGWSLAGDWRGRSPSKRNAF
jgi:hypothetical protein